MEGNIPPSDKTPDFLGSFQAQVEKDMENARGVRLTNLGSIDWWLEEEMNVFDQRINATAGVLEQSDSPRILTGRFGNHANTRLALPRVQREYGESHSPKSRPAWRLIRGDQQRQPPQAVQESIWEIKQEDIRLRLAAAMENPSSSLWLEAADIEGVLGDNKAEKAYIETALGLNIGDGLANRHMANYYEKQGIQRKMMIYLKRAVAAGFEEWQDNYDIVDHLLGQGKTREAHRFAMIFLERTAFRTDAEACIYFAALFVRLQDKKRVRKCAYQAVKISRDAEDAEDIFQAAQKVLQSLQDGGTILAQN